MKEVFFLDIRNIKSNLNILKDNNLVKILFELFLQDISKVNDYSPDVIYNKGDRVYIQENGKHQIYQCVAKQSSLSFIKDEWQYIVEVFDSQIDLTTNAIKIVEELHIIDSNTVNGIETQLDINEENTVAIYHGKKRYARDYDFEINGNQILFNNPLNIGDRIILEVKHRVGVRAVGIILYDLNGNPYLVSVTDTGVISVIPHSEHSSTDIKYTEIVTGDCTYTLLVDASYSRPQLGLYKNINKYITGTDDRIYRIDVENGIVKLTDNTGFIGHSDKKYILGSDRNFYTVTDTEVTLVENHQMDPKDYEFGIKVITNEFEHRVIDIVNGEMILRKYITNGGYHNINFVDRYNGDTIRLTVNDETMLEMYDGLDREGYSGTRLLDYFYFFDNEWNYNRMFVENGNLLFETCDLDVVPDSKGINLLKKDGEMVKLRIPAAGEGIHIVKCISLNNMGTFESPIEGFVMKINDETKLITVNKETNGFEIVDTDLPFRTNHHYILSTDGKIYKLAVIGDVVTFVEGLGDDNELVYYLEDGVGGYYYLNVHEGDVLINRTNSIPNDAKTGVVVIDHEGRRFRLQNVDNVPTFIEVNERYDNEITYIACINDVTKYCYFNIHEDNIIYNELGVAKVELDDEYDIECVTTGAFIKSNEMITRFDITDGDCVFNPISTFVHRIKSANNNEVFVLDVEGEPYNEVLTIKDFNVNDFESEVGYGHLYLMDDEGNHYTINTNSNGKFIINKTDAIEDVDYSVSSLIYSSKGLYRMIVEDNDIKLEKLFDNMYENVLSYGNIVKKAFNIQSVNGVWYSLAANGLGEVVADKVDVVDIKGLFLRSDDGYNYGLGMLGDKFITYRSFISNPNVTNSLLIRDKENGIVYKLFMNGDKLCSDICYDDVNNTSLIMYDVYNKGYKIEMVNNILTVSSL